MVIRRARRVSDFLRAQCFAVAVQPSNTPKNPTNAGHSPIERHIRFARDLHIDTRVLRGNDPAPLVVEFARLHQVTQIFVIRPTSRRGFLPRNPIQRIIDLAKDIQIVIVSDRERTFR